MTELMCRRTLQFRVMATVSFILVLGIKAVAVGEERHGSPLTRIELPAGSVEGQRLEMDRRDSRYRAVELIYPEGLIGSARAWLDGELLEGALDFRPGASEQIRIPFEPGGNLLNIQLRGHLKGDSEANPVIWEYFIPVRFQGSIAVHDGQIRQLSDEEADEMADRYRRMRQESGHEGGRFIRTERDDG